jgi:hypothetical protein
MALCVGGLVSRRELDPRASLASQFDIGIRGLRYTPQLNDLLLGLLSLTAGVVLLAISARRRFGPPLPPAARGKTAAIWLTGALLVGGFGYFYGSRGIGEPYYLRLWDSFHGFLGAKYHREIGYFGLYECVVAADQGRLVGERSTMTDLRTYRPVPVSGVRPGERCGGRFTPERWRAFRQDLAPFRLYAMGYFPRILSDFGYNGTPLQTLLAGKLAFRIRADFRNLTLLSLIDVAALCAMFTAICWAFGWKTGFVFALFFFLNFSDRFVHVGGSYLRYLWMLALGLGLALLARRRYASSAVAITASAMLNAFPALFLAGIGGKALVEAIGERRVAPERARFLAAAAATAILLGVPGACHGRGWSNYGDFLAKMASHVQVQDESRIGLRYLFQAPPSHAAPGEWPASPGRNGGSDSLPFLFYPVAAAMLGALLAIMRRLDDVEATVLVGMLLLFVLFGTVQYYYASASLLALLWYRRAASAGGAAMIALLFLINAAIHTVWQLGGDLRLCDSIVTSLALALYFAVTLGYLACEPGRSQRLSG